MKTLVAIVSLFFAFSCSPKENLNTVPGGSIDIIAKPKKITANTNRNTQSHDTIKMVAEDGKGIYRADGEINSVHSRIYVIFTNNKAPGDLYAVVTPEKDGANLRFNQILFPDKSADGPFGKEIAIKLNQIGKHTLIVGHSQMAEDRYQGKFKIDLQVE